jgi:predicted dehydrogenase/threonine dehydrogenase-like Zn-dependent dehydrogenase
MSVKQVVQNFKTGEVSVGDVAVPQLRPGCLLVRNRASLISAGTEGGTVKLGKMGLLGKARARPEQVKKVLQTLKTEGVLATFNAVSRTLDLPIPLGYSCAGIVEAAMEESVDLPVGTRVACGGGGKAFHADYVVVPRNLCVPIPAGVSFQHAAFTTVGAVAMQGVRIADLRLGENAVVVGLGLVGLLVMKILQAGGMHVFGIDTDSQRVAWIRENGLCRAEKRDSEHLMDRVLEFTKGYGADAVIITAGVASSDPVVLAGELCRYRGRVVVVGRTLMNAPRETYLFKELELRTSLAYGPGTEDPSYEIEGHDYPIGYVRWTENRNMQCFLDLLGERRMDISPLVTHTLPIEKAPQAYEIITSSEHQSIGVVLEYGGAEDAKADVSPTAAPEVRRAPASASRCRIGIIGAGAFATNIMLPILAKRKDVQISAIASANGLRAAALGRKYSIAHHTSNVDEIMEADHIDCVFVLTRHGTHAAFTERALRANKHVFVEKPLALDGAGLASVEAAQEQSGKVLMVGFNRRFSPLCEVLRKFFTDRGQPMVIDYRGNVGYRPPEHWLHDPQEGGGVILGEACHYIDFCAWLVDSPIVEVSARCLGPSKTRVIPEDNAEISLRFQDGSMANILYLSNGAAGFGRERCEIHAESKSAVWEDFKYVRLCQGLGRAKVYRKRFLPQKGYKEELDRFFAATRETGAGATEWLPGQLDASRAAIQAATRLRP